MGCSRIFSVISFLILSFAVAPHAMSATGSAGSVVAGNTGAARFRIPIDVPPGPGGLAPRLALTYSSRAADGPFGVGWRLAGMGEVRCSARFGVPDYASCTRFELDGQLLSKEPDPSDQYHTFVESFARVVYIPPGSATNPNSWEVTRTDGTILRYGTTSDSQVGVGPDTARWLLAEIVDPFGNTIFVTYDELTDVGTRYPVRITYGPAATAASGKRQVEFRYETRPDRLHDYAAGIERVIAQRLKEIRVLSYGAIFQRHVFGYDTGVSYTTVRSRFSWAQVFGTDCGIAFTDPETQCAGLGLPRQEFEYTDPTDTLGAGPNQRAQWEDAPEYESGGNPWYYLGPSIHLSHGDINGDGLVDRLGIQGALSINTGSGYDYNSQESAAWRAAYASLQYEQPRMLVTQAYGFDVEADGSGISSGYGVCAATLTETVRSITEAAPWAKGPYRAASHWTYPDSFIEATGRVILQDINADGLADLVVSVRLSGVHITTNCPDGSTIEGAWEYREGTTVSIVFRNTGNPQTGWVRDDSLAQGLPPFGELVFEGEYFTQWQQPDMEVMFDQCTKRGLRGGITGEDVCFNLIDFAPRFVDLNGDGFLDLIALEREDPASHTLWVNAPLQYVSPTQKTGLRSHAWLQDPQAPPGMDRWVRARRFDLPERSISPCDPECSWAHSTSQMRNDPPSPSPLAAEDYPVIYNVNTGVQLADLNRDGLTDVVWSLTYYNTTDPGNSGADRGVLINTGRGTAGSPASAWCTDYLAEATELGIEHCLWSAAYIPPDRGFATLISSAFPSNFPMGHLGDVNGDGWLDYVKISLQIFMGFGAWLQFPGNASGFWHRDDRFDPFTDDEFCIVTGECLAIQPYAPAFAVMDVNGDGVSDVIGANQARISIAHHPDLIRTQRNGQGGRIDLAYEPALASRDTAIGGLEEAAEGDATFRGEDLAASPGDAVIWTPRPVVSSVTVSGPNLGGPLGEAVLPTTYRYAHPRVSVDTRSDLGFRLVERTRPDGSRVEHYVYQHHGRSGRTSKTITVDDTGNAVHEYQEDWDLPPGPIPGSIAHADVHVGRLAASRSKNLYGGVAGAEILRSFSYDDTYGYNFVSGVLTQRPTGVLRSERTPEPDDGHYILGRVQDEKLFDAEVGGTLLQETAFTYTSGRLASRTQTVKARSFAGTTTYETTSFSYDAYGNLASRTQELVAGNRTTRFCYDGDTLPSWCPVFSGHDSHSVRIGVQDALGKITCWRSRENVEI